MNFITKQETFMNQLDKEKTLKMIDERIAHHESWLEHLYHARHYHSITQWGSKLEELKEIRKLLSIEL